jgi:hypothetical protein
MHAAAAGNPSQRPASHVALKMALAGKDILLFWSHDY